MLKPLVTAAALCALAAVPSHASNPTVACLGAAAYAVQHNPYNPFPSGGGGGEPHTPMPGQPGPYVQYDVAAFTACAK